MAIVYTLRYFQRIPELGILYSIQQSAISFKGSQMNAEVHNSSLNRLEVLLDNYSQGNAGSKQNKVFAST